MLRCQKANHGFTLVEMLVAVVILAIALGALMDSMNTVVRNGVALQERTLALWIAEDVLNESRIANNWPATGITNGKRELDGKNWPWQLNVEQTPETGIFKATINVFHPNDDERALSTLTTYFTRYGRPGKLLGATQ